MPFIELPEKLPGLRAQARSDRPWYRITNQAADEAEVMLYDEVGGWLGATADEFINDLRGITAPKILLRINSPGGSVTEGIAIANALRSHPASVTVQVDGVAASIASVIAMAGDHVRLMPNALFMVHEASGLCAGEAADMLKMAELLDKISDNIAGAYAARAGGTEAEWRQVMKNETWYRGEEAVAAGLADEYVSAPKRGTESAEPEMSKTFDFAAYGYAGPQQPEPKPESMTLTFNIGDAIGEQILAALRKEVAGRDPAPEVTAAEATPEQPVEEPPRAPEMQGEHGPELLALTPEPAAPAEAPTPEPADPWADMVAHLTKDEPDAWSVLVSNLTTTASSSAATEA